MPNEDNPNSAQGNSQGDSDDRMHLSPRTEGGEQVKNEAKFGHEEHRPSQGHAQPPQPSWFVTKLKEVNPAEWAMTFFTVIIAVATVCYTVYAGRQWHVMSGQLTVMQRTLQLTNNQVESASGAVVYAWRPFSFVKPTDMNINFTNSGHTTATHVHAILDISLFSVPSLSVVDKRPQRTLDLASIGPSNPSDPQSGNNRYTWRIPYAVSKQEALEMADGKIGMRAILHESYNDGFRVINNQDCYISLGFSIKAPYYNASGGNDSECSDLSNTVGPFYKMLMQVRREAKLAAQKHQKKPN